MFLSVSCSVLDSAEEHVVAGDGQCSLTVSCSYSSARSAFPSALPTVDVYYFAIISYEKNGTRYLGKSSAALESPEYLSNSGTVASPCFLFATPVYSGQYTITLYLCSTEIFALANCGAQGTATLPLDKGQRSYSSTLSVALSPITSGSTGTGTVSLSYSWSLSTVTGGSVTVTNSAGTAVSYTSGGNPSGLTLTSDNYTTGATLSGTLAAGTYTVVLSLSASGTNVPLSNPVQIITVYAGFTTDKWYDAAGTAVTALPVTNTVQTVFYVCGKNPSVYGNSITSGTYTTADTNSGTMLAPFATVPAAVNKIIAANDGASTYYIYIDGTCTDSSVATYTSENNKAYINISTTKALTLVIQPFGSTQATINAGRDSTKTGRVMYVSGSSVNLTLNNLTLTGGYSDNGGGINIASGTLTLATCTITGNTVTGYGGGLYASGGIITMSGTISNNSASTGKQYYIGTGATYNGTAGVQEVN